MRRADLKGAQAIAEMDGCRAQPAQVEGIKGHALTASAPSPSFSGCRGNRLRGNGDSSGGLAFNKIIPGRKLHCVRVLDHLAPRPNRVHRQMPRVRWRVVECDAGSLRKAKVPG